MKTLVGLLFGRSSFLAGTLILTANVGAFAQGTIIFNNSSSQVLTFGLAMRLVAPVGTHVALYYSPTEVSYPFDYRLHLLASGTVGPVAGRFSLGTYTTGTDAAPGSTIYCSVRGWTGNYATWDEAMAAMMSGMQVIMGWSPSVFQMGTGGVGVPPTIPVSLSSIPGFTGLLYIEPEPTVSSLALVALAVIGLRRRFQR